MLSSQNVDQIKNFFQELNQYLKTINKDIVITSHKQADPDSLGAGLTMHYLLSTLKPESVQFVLPSISKQTEKIIKNFDIGSIVKQEITNFSKVDNYCIILVDTNEPSITDLNLIFKTSESVDAWNKCSKRIILDHHIQSNENDPQADLHLIIPDYNSASELAYELLKCSGITDLNEKILSVNLVGILYDTKRLVLANTRVLANVSSILERIDETIEDYLQYLDNEKDYSERIANLKAAQRNKLTILLEKYLLSFSFVSSFESSSARALQFLGSDITAVINRTKNEIRISFRSSKRFYDETKFHCGQLAKFIAEKYSGTGSGHPTAAGCNLPISNTNNELFESISAFIGKYLENKSNSDIDK